MTGAITTMLERMSSEPARIEATARAEAERLFAPDVVCASISEALQRLVLGASAGGA